MDRLWVYTSVRDEEALMPWFLRHYLTVADRIVVQDCGSTDRTRAIVQASPRTEYRDSGTWGMDEKRRKDDSHQFVHEAAHQCKWCICVDADEIVIGDYERALADGERADCAVLHTKGCTMLNEGLPVDDGKSQIYELAFMGVPCGAIKPVVVRAGAQFEWSVGRHFIETPETRVAQPLLTLLHYRYLGADYTAKRNARNYQNSPEKLTAFACAPDYTGNESAAAVARNMSTAVDLREIWKRGYGENSAFAPHLTGMMIQP